LILHTAAHGAGMDGEAAHRVERNENREPSVRFATIMGIFRKISFCRQSYLPELAALEEEVPFQATPRNLPERRVVACREPDHHLDCWLGGKEVTGHERHR
jgi:hypothetical protein